MADDEHTAQTPQAEAQAQAQAHSHLHPGSFFTRRGSLFRRKKHSHRQSSAPATSPHLTPSSTIHTPSSPPSLSQIHIGSSSAHTSTSTTTASLNTTTSSTPTPLPPDSSQSGDAAAETPPRRKHGRHSSRHSISSSVADIGATLRRSRSASLRTNTSTNTSSSSHKKTPSATLALSFSPEKQQSSTQSNGAPTAAPSSSSSSTSLRPTLSISTFSRSKKSQENVKSDKTPLSAVDNPKTPFGMAVPLRYPPSAKEIRQAQASSSYANALGPAPAVPSTASGSHNPSVIFQHIHELASKRISTLDYLRKAHEGRIYWFNTLLFSKPDLARLPSFTPRNLARRATNYLLLGFSLPTVLDLNSTSATDYLRALNALLLEFETYQSLHPPDGSHPSSLSRGRIPQMFKRSVLPGGGKARRSSSAANDIPTLSSQPSDPLSAIEPPSSDPSSSDLLNPGEEYTLLLTPSLPFDPDFYSTFATLCDVLIDCYTKVMSLLATPESVMKESGGVPSTVGDLFAKADARIRKIILSGIVKEFEEASRTGVRGEVAGVGKVILGGLC